MSKSFNPKKYQGSNRIFSAIPGCIGVLRLYVWDEHKKQYVRPPRGKCYQASRYDFDQEGKKKRVKASFSTFEEAKAWRAYQGETQKKQEDFIFESRSVSEKRRYSFFDLVEDYKRHRFPSLREQSRNNYMKNLKLLKFFYGYEVEDISPKALDEWFSWLKSKEKMKTYKSSRRFFEKEVDSLRSILNWYLRNNDDAKLVLPFKDRHKEMMLLKPKMASKSKAMTSEECDLWVHSLLQNSPNFYEAGVVQMGQLLRVSEVFAMKWKHLDLRTETYRVCEYAVWPRKKNAIPRIDSGAKNMVRGEYYDMPLRAKTLELLSNLKKSASNELIFHNEGRIWTYRQIQYGYDKAFRKANLPYSSTHVCRHTGATRFLDETGGDYLALQQMGNWSDLKQALHYGKTMKDRARSALKRADGKVTHLKCV